MLIKNQFVVSAIRASILSIASDLDYKLKEIIPNSVAERNGYLWDKLSCDGEGVDRYFDSLVVPSALANGVLDERVELAHQELVDNGQIVGDTSILKRITLSKNMVYRNAVVESSRSFFNTLQDELSEHVVDDEDDEYFGKLPRNFDYRSIYAGVIEDGDVITTDAFDTEC